MTVQADIYHKLDTLGTAYPLSLPPNPTLPAMVYQFISEAPQRSHSGASLTRYRLQVACWAKTYKEAVTLADSVVAALDLNQTTVKLITHENGFEDKEVETGLSRRLVEFYVWE